MELHEALYTTRAMRRLKPDPVPLDVQARILDAAIRAPHIAQQWHFLLVDDRELMAQIGALYRVAVAAFYREMGADIEALAAMPGSMGRSARSAVHLAEHFDEVPLLLIGFAKTQDGSGIYPALWSAMLAARAEGVGSTLTGMLHSRVSDEMMTLLNVPAEEDWVMHGAIPMGFPLGKWGVAERMPIQDVASRNLWGGDSGIALDAPLWPAANTRE